MSNTLAFWLGLTLSIPVAIAVNLITPTLQKLITTANANQRLKLQASREKEKAFAQRLSANHTAVTVYLISKSNLITFSLIASLGLFIVSLVLIVSARFLPTHHPLLFRIFFDAGGFLSLFMCVVNVVRAINAARAATYVQNYILFKETPHHEAS